MPPTTHTLISTALLSAAFIAATGSPAAANPLDSFGFGARSVAMGGAVTATADDFSANYYNPAALARGQDMRLDFGYVLTDPSLAINGRDVNVDPSQGFEGGVTLPGKIFGRRLAVSVGLFLPDARITRVRALPQRQPRFVLYDNRPQRLVITTSGALEIVEDLFFGFGLTYLSNTGGTVEIDGVVSASKVEDTRLFSGVDVSLPAVRYPSFGLLWTPGPWRLGLTWREEFSLEIDLGLTVKGDVVFGEEQTIVAEDGSFAIRSVNTNLFSPRQVALGVGYEAQRWLVSADLTWLDWSSFPTPTAAVAVSIDVPGLPLDIPPSAVPVAPEFHDILVPRLGAQWTAIDGPRLGLALRAGYFFEPTPAPDQPGPTNYIDNDKHGFSIGAGLRLSNLTEVFPKPILIDLALQTILMPERLTLKDDPADPVGDYSAGGHFVGGSLTCKFLF